jgi:hypothetical protein
VFPVKPLLGLERLYTAGADGFEADTTWKTGSSDDWLFVTLLRAGVEEGWKTGVGAGAGGCRPIDGELPPLDMADPTAWIALETAAEKNDCADGADVGVALTFLALSV